MTRPNQTFHRMALCCLFVLICCTWLHAQPAAAPDAAAAAPAALESESPSRALTLGFDRFEWMRRDLWNQPRWKYVSFGLYSLLAFLVSKLLDYLTRVQLKRWAEKTTTRLDDLLLQLLRGPVKVVAFVIFLHLALEVFEWPHWAEKTLSKTLSVVVAFSVTYMILKAVDIAMNFWKEKTATEENRLFHQQLFPVIRKSIKIFIVLLAALFTAQNVFEKNITSILAGLSIGGLALGLAAQDTLGNLFGAVAVFVDRPFKVGDHIQMDQVNGTVESIGLRSTRVRNLDGHLVTIPNKTMGNATITNIAMRPGIKTTMNIGITYNTPAAKVQEAAEIIHEVYKSHPKSGDIIISFNRFESSSLNILLVHWWQGTVFKDYLKGLHELNLKLKERFDQAGIQFAFPTQTVYLKQDSEWKIEGRGDRAA